MRDIVDSLIVESELPGKLQKESLKKSIINLDLLIEKNADEDRFLNIEFLSQAKIEAESFLSSGYKFTKASVLVPAGLLGMSKGFVAPDLDISILGIGNHRFFLFHSTLGLVVLRHLHMRWLLSQKNPDKFFSRVSRKVSGAALGSFAMGVGLHLAVDVFQPKSIVFPFWGSLVDGTLVDDNIWLMGNSIWAFRIGKEMFALSIASELESAKDYVKDRFGSLKNNHEFQCDLI